MQGDSEVITNLLGDYERERTAMEKDIANLVYYMNGGLSYPDAYNLSQHQMKILSETISKHYEMQADAYKKAGNKK